MELLRTFFEGQNTSIHTVIFILVFIGCWILEDIFAISQIEFKKKHFLNNLLFSMGGALVQIIVGMFFLTFLTYENTNNIGLLHRLGITIPLFQLFSAFIFLDFTYWLYHFFMHKIPVLWRFHSVHHSDPNLNVSTSLREHPVETGIRLFHYVFFVLLLGPALWIVTLHQFIQIISKIIIHGNFSLPRRTDKVLSMILITPNMHQVHHHFENPYTDSNFGDLFSFWDRLFSTFKVLKKDKLVFGLDQYPEQKCQPENWFLLLKRPFYRAFFSQNRDS